ncbi:hypothetical protein ACIBF7_03435 [Nonomuraea sp. NPDC050478]|uniref:hypothetical protein n=1 Tax=Nonomuraea sp. NPDC050478 TaxID=3364365 RepID=UPI0037B8BA8E
MSTTSYVYGRQVGGVSERFVILVAPGPTGMLLHEEHTRGGGRHDILLNRIVPPLPAGQTAEAWLKERDEELQAGEWGPPTCVAGIR